VQFSELKKARQETLIVDEIGKVLPALFRKQVRRAEPYLLEILLPLWPRIVGKVLAEHSRPASFSSGVLTLATDCATWSTQLRHLAEEMRAGINSFMGQPVVKKLRITTLSQPDLFAPKRRSRGATFVPPPRLDRRMNTDSIPDPEIAALLASSCAKYFNRPGR
jgi:hypothetical protein